MPIYEYKCVNCGTHLEKMQKVTDAPLTICEDCGGKLEKQWSRSGFQFKGEGWYVTDYARKGSVAETVEKDLAAPEPTAKTEDKAKPKKTSARKTDKK